MRGTPALPRRWAALAASLPFLAAAPAARAAWPDRPVRLIVPFPAGSATDTIARLFAEPLGRELGQPVVVENRPGGNGVVGTEAGARAAADGNTLLVYSTSGAAVSPHTLKRVPYDPMRDFAPVGFIAEMPYLLVVGPDSPVRDLRGFFEQARRRDGGVAFSYGNSASLIAIAMLERQAGARFNPIPYRGGPEALTDVMTGRVDATFTDLGPGLSQVRAGKVRAIGVTTREPFPLVPGVPPVATALPGFDVTVWYGLAAPAGTPGPVLARCAAALNAAIDDPTLVERFGAQGYVPRHMGAEAFGRFLEQQFALWGERVRAAGIEPQ